MSVLSQTEREQREREFWETDVDHRPDVFSLPNLFNKMSEVAEFRSAMADYLPSLQGTILELGGGQLWSSCVLKAERPDLLVIGSDIAAAAVEAAPIWETIFRVKLDGKLVCTSYDVPLPDASVDTVFAFQAAHHFGEHAKTLHEIARILKPCGRALYLAEPTCSPLTYDMAVRRVNAIRPEVPEDYLVRSRIKVEALAAGLDLRIVFAKAARTRSLVHHLYYATLNLLPPFQALAPSAATLVFTKQ